MKVERLLDGKMKCDTKYPLLFVHGMGFRDYKKPYYWGRIPKVLTENGAKIYYGLQDGTGGTETNARRLVSQIQFALKDLGAEKLNIISHSKGGTDSRYVISSLGCHDKIASLTTISTPHNGSLTADKLIKLPDIFFSAYCACSDTFYRVLGDKKTNAFKAYETLRTDKAEEFNRANPDCPGVYYQSYAFVMKNAFSDVFYLPGYLLVKHFEGENDGIFSPRSVAWGNFRGVYTGAGRRGISHYDEVDFRRRRFSSKRGKNVSDITEFYVNMAEELKERGF